MKLKGKTNKVHYVLFYSEVMDGDACIYYWFTSDFQLLKNSDTMSSTRAISAECISAVLLLALTLKASKFGFNLIREDHQVFTLLLI